MKITKKRIKDGMITHFNGGKYDHYFEFVVDSEKYSNITFCLRREVLEIISYYDISNIDSDYERGYIYDGKNGFIEAVFNHLKNVEYGNT